MLDLQMRSVKHNLYNRFFLTHVKEQNTHSANSHRLCGAPLTASQPANDRTHFFVSASTTSTKICVCVAYCFQS
jgi:hypothetical protein